MCALILSSVNTYRNHPEVCPVADCNLALNRLVRGFCEQMGRDQRGRRYSTMAAREANQGCIKDHIVPIRVIQQKLLSLPIEELEVCNSNLNTLEEYLARSLVTCRVTYGENLTLGQRYQSCMPEGYEVLGSPFQDDEWARYKATDLYASVGDLGSDFSSRIAAG